MAIPSNVGPADRGLRTLIGFVLVALAALGVVSGGLAVAAYVVAVVLFATAAVGYCPAYRLLGINTCRVHSAPRT